MLLVAAQFDSALEDLLYALLCAHMPNLTEAKRKAMVENGPFSALATRIEIVYAMGAIDETMRQDLNALRSIRNKFAHPTGHLHLELKEMRVLLHGFKGYDAKMDSFAFFTKKTDEMWAALKPKVENAMLKAGLLGDHPNEAQATPARQRNGRKPPGK